MLVTIQDGNGNPVAVTMPGQENPTDRSGTVTAAGVRQSIAVENLTRSGWKFQNQGMQDMAINILGNPASFAGASIIVSAGQMVGAPCDLPLTTQALELISGEQGAKFLLLEW